MDVLASLACLTAFFVILFLGNRMIAGASAVLDPHNPNLYKEDFLEWELEMIRV